MEVRPDAPQDPASTGPRIEGVQVVRLHRYADHRGSLTPIMADSSFWSEPVVHAYRITIRPGRIKGWGMHRLQADRYCIEAGRVRVVLYDGRVASATHRSSTSSDSMRRRRRWCGSRPGSGTRTRTPGTRDAAILNFPTRAYDREDPDKHRIDPHSGEIPFDWSLRDS